MHFLSPDSRLMRGLSNLTDAILINVLLIITSIPVITAGASLTAAHVAARKAIVGEGHLFSNYVQAWKRNLLQSLPLWLVYGVTGGLLVYAWLFLQITPLLVPKFGFSIIWLFGFEWVFALQARFENSVGRTLVNALVFSVTNIGYTLVMIAMDAVYVGLLVACWILMPQGLFLLVVLGYGTLIMLHIPLLERALRKYINEA